MMPDTLLMLQSQKKQPAPSEPTLPIDAALVAWRDAVIVVQDKRKAFTEANTHQTVAASDLEEADATLTKTKKKVIKRKSTVEAAATNRETYQKALDEIAHKREHAAEQLDAAVHQAEAAFQALNLSAHEHYKELVRDKRTELDLSCPTWPPVDFWYIDPTDPDKRRKIHAQRPEGCKCEHMTVKHENQVGLIWCQALQAAHAQEDPEPHPVISEADFLQALVTVN